MSKKNLLAGLTDQATQEPVLMASEADVLQAACDMESAVVLLDSVQAAHEELDAIMTDFESFDTPLTQREAAIYGNVLAQFGDDVIGEADLESFAGGESARQAATDAATEAVGETLKKFWQGIKNAFSRAWQAVKNWFASLFGGVSKLVDRAKAAEKRAQEKGIKEKNVKVSGIGKMHLGGKVDNAVVAKGLAAVDKELFPAVESMGEMVGLIAGLKIANIIEKAKPAETEEEATSFFKTITDKVSKAFEKTEKELSALRSTFPGDVQFRLTKDVDLKGEGIIEEVTAKTKLPSVEILKGDFKGKESDEVEPMSVENITAVRNFVEVYEELVKAKKEEEKEIEKGRKELNSTFDKMIEESDRGSLGKFWTAGRVRGITSKMTKIATRASDKAFAYIFSLVRAYLAYAEASVK